MLNLSSKSDCCGCTACEHICPVNAITMQPDELGFQYPIVDNTICISCGKCIDVCAFQNGYSIDSNITPPLVFAVRHKKISEIESSRSGAMFNALTDEILKNGGVIYGVGYKDNFRVAHKRAVNKEERNEFKGSKYVQSDLGFIFKQVKQDLKNGLIVLFSGTPCQTAGLTSFLMKTDTRKLILCDIVCHGVPSPYIWRDYLVYIEKKYKQRIVQVNFRDKSLGWAAHKESFVFGNGNKVFSYSYTSLFYKHVIIRPSCGNCKYTNTSRPSDITLADFWGIEKVSTDFNADNKGVSLVLLNTPKGIELFEKVKTDLNFIECNIIDCLQPNLQKPTTLSVLSANLSVDYKNRGFKFVSDKYGETGFRRIFERIIFDNGILLTKRILKKLIHT